MAKILSVDEEERILQYYMEELSAEGHHVVAVASGDQLLKIDIHRPEVVVLDIRLVEWDGLELLNDIRNRHYDLPVILCTAYDTYKEDPKSMAADYYVVKSFDLSELETTIKRALDAHVS